MEILKGTPWSRIREQNSVDKEFLEIFGNGGPTGSVLEEDNCSFRHDINKRGKMTQSNTSPNSFMQQNERKASRTRSPRGRSPSGRNVSVALQGLPQKELATTRSVKKWHPPECLFYKTKSGCRFGEKCSYAHRQVDEQPSKRSQKEWWQECRQRCVEEEWLARKCTATCCPTLQKSRQIRATW